jgi:predicted outer membrane repeat protein
VSNNTGGCCNGVDALGALRATRTVIRGNNGDDSNGLYTGEGRVVLNKVKVLDNDATSTSGQNGVYLGDGNAVMNDIRIVGNSGGPSGNGCCNGLVMGAGNLTLRRAVISHNNGGGCCNGIQGNEGEATLRDIVVTRNTGNDCCQGIESNGSPMTITRATVSENIDSTDCCTGIITDPAGPVTLRNVTVSGNSAATFGGGISTGGLITLNNVTVTNNRADSDDSGGENGGGIFVGAGAVQIRNSIVAGNSVASAGTGPDCFGTLTSEGHNLIGETDGCTIASGGGNLLDVDPLLAPLRNNGGLTKTHALRRRSPAIDRGSAQTPGSGGNSCEKRDQRGVRRPQGGRCDVGAYERKSHRD